MKRYLKAFLKTIAFFAVVVAIVLAVVVIVKLAGPFATIIFVAIWCFLEIFEKFLDE